MRKRLLGFALCAAMALTAMTGCGASGGRGGFVKRCGDSRGRRGRDRSCQGG